MMTEEQILISGMLELYVIGDMTDQEMKQIEARISESEMLLQELKIIEVSLEQLAFSNAIEADPTFKPMMLAVADYTKRLSNGEKPIDPPSLHSGSKISDFKEWIDRDDMQEPETYESMHGKIIGSNDEKTSLIVWLKDGAPDETHTDKLEKFLIIEGTCDIKIGNQVHSLQEGDYLSIPLYINHTVTVTSAKRCKIILERAAA